MTRRVAVFMPGRAELSSIAVPTDLLQLANRFARERTGASEGAATRDEAAPLACRWLSIDGGPVSLSSGGSLDADGGLDQELVYDAVFVASYEANNSEAPHAAADGASKRSEWLRRQHREGATIAAFGSGVLLLAESGLLDRRVATAPWWQHSEFHRRYPAVRLDASQRVTEHDRLLCAGSLAGLLPMALRVVQRLTSPNTAAWLARTTLIDTTTELGMLKAAAPQDDAGGDALVAAALYQLQQHYADKAQLGDLAATLAVSPRTLSRRFHRALGLSPQDYVQALRIDAAKRMLLRTSLRVDRVGLQVGYGDLGFFKRVFRSQTGMTPTAWRVQARLASGTEAGPAQ
ncbi:MAG: transcriptional regulator [Hydrocarboniphaga sp.]|uniref:GlxA family transcriptional regulator n=1 Tax=Hydrocarboniphaga sp. TaxID=2033016 RepID=UPI0026024398|nr:helix-turn-helix domain-containing protein [Hydrocarboniphaga sp.]MDB5968039.1 transcriptional regulator [Hydrocarboniphaga sp.]